MAIEALKPTQTAVAMGYLFAANRRVMLHGDPGIGKSQLTMQVADAKFAAKYGANGARPYFIEIRAAQWDAVDLRGLPKVDPKTGKTGWAVPETLPTDNRGGIVFLDEINRGTEMVQNALFQLCDQGCIGEYRLPAGWQVCAAVNDSDVGARKMSAALLARFSHIDMRTDLDDVCAHAVANDWAPEVYAFLRFRPTLLHKFNPKERVSPNPRAWDFVSQLTKQNVPAGLMLQLVAGHVGEAAAVEYVAFLRLFHAIPDIDAIIANPKTASIPTANPLASVMYAVAAALARRATTTNFGSILTYLDRLPVEYAVSSVTDAVRRNKDLTGTKGYTLWAAKHAELVLV
jgi:MoxR-like ATPase